MKQINGRIDLISLIGNFEKALKNGQIQEAKECSTMAYWIKDLNGKNYLFKTYESDNQKYRSLLVEKMANTVGIEVAHTQMAFLGYYDGELVEDYRKPMYQYITGTQILAEYLEFLRLCNQEEWEKLVPLYSRVNYEEDEIYNKMNNMETIEKALNHHFRKSSRKEEYVSKMIQDLKDRFCLDFLTMQRDRGHNNWEIEENLDQTSVKLAPMIDSNRSFYFPSFQVSMPPLANMKVSDLYEKLEVAMNIEGYDCFSKLYEEYLPWEVERLITEIEEENHFKMENSIKLEILGSYKEHYQRLTEVMERRKGMGR